MKHLKRFSTHVDYDVFIGGMNVDLPNVSICNDEINIVHFNKQISSDDNLQHNDEILYTTTTNETIDPSSYYEGLTMVSNTYDGEKCVMRFEEDITDITQLFNNDNREENETQLLTVQLPETVEIIGEYTFYKCSSLTVITIPESVMSIGNNAFKNCSGLISVTIPSGVTSIGESAFMYCSGLASVTIGNGVTSIGESAFMYCTGLTSVTIGNGVTSIGSKAFSYCSGLTSVTIPNNVTVIGKASFLGCTNLTTMTVEATTPPTLSDRRAIPTSIMAIYVPAQSVNAYKTASVWSAYANIIQAIP